MELNDRVKIKPAQGLTIIDPSTGRPLPEKGKEIVVDVYWFRRWEQGEILVIPASETATEPKRAGKHSAKKETEV